MLKYFWIYLKPLLLIGESLGFCNYLYLLWVLSITPLVHILQNDLTAQMVGRDIMNVDTIDDLIDDRVEVYADYYLYSDFQSPEYYSQFEPTFQYKFKQMLQRLRQMNTQQLLFNVIEKQTSFYEMFKNIVVITNKVFLSTVESFISRLVPYHIGRPDLPIYLTPLCYAPDFQYSDKAYVM